MAENKTPEYITEGDGFVEVALVRGLKVAGATIKSVRMREPTVADQLAIDRIEGQGAKEIAIIGNLCEVAPNDLHALTMRDYTRLQVALGRFIA